MLRCVPVSSERPSFVRNPLVGAVALCLGAFALTGPAPAAAATIIPILDETTEGNLLQSFPFGSSGPVVYQQIYAGSDFGPDPLWLAAVSFRLDAGSAGVASTVLPDISVLVSTLPAFGLSGDLTANRGTDLTTVFDGDLTVSSAGGGRPNAFDITIDFDSPWTFDPSAGSLVVEIRTGGATTLAPLDAQMYGDASGSVIRALGIGLGAETGTVKARTGLVTAFETVPSSVLTTQVVTTPLPGGLVLLGSAMGLAMIARRRRSRDR